MKIGFVLDDSLDKADGVQQYVLSIGEWLKRQNHQVHYLVSTSTRQDVTNVHTLARNMAVRFNGNRLSMPLPANRMALKKLLAEEQFDVLHVQVPYSPLLAGKLINLAPARTVVVGTFHIMPHTRLVELASRGLAIWTSKSLKRFDAMLSVSTAAQAFAKQTFGVDSRVLPNVVDVARFQTAKPFPEYKQVLTILFLGRLVPRKGCRVLLEAVNELSKRTDVPSYQVVICGKGPLEAELKTFVRAHKLESLVNFTGYVTEADKPRYLKSADVAVFPSNGGESFGIVLLEAMAAGAVTLGADNSGYHSVLAPNPALLFPVGNAKALAKKLADYLLDSAKRQSAADWEEAYVKAFDVSAVGQQIVGVYEEALRQRQNMQ